MKKGLGLKEKGLLGLKVKGYICELQNAQIVKNKRCSLNLYKLHSHLYTHLDIQQGQV
jgi:hypothetical protein